MKTTNINENQGTSNIKYIVDSSGKGWICDINLNQGNDLSDGGCIPADEWHYDRMFGG